jgi:NAD+ diphosphatase
MNKAPLNAAAAPCHRAAMEPIFYTGLALDRAHRLRPQSARLAGDPRVAVVPLWRDLALVAGEPPRAVLAEAAEAVRLLALAPDPVFLGLDGVRPLFAVDLPAGEAAPDLRLPGEFTALRGMGHLLPAWDGALLAYARAMVLWHRRNRFCGSCGGATVGTDGGHLRVCRACGEQSYPRTDPAVIMLVADGPRVLLHRQRAWPPGMWSCLAGFVEPGETLEEAVARETLEETGIVVGDVGYAASQPWPFPASLMVAFTARAVGGELAPDTGEIEDARWFDRADLAGFDDCNRESGSGCFLARPGTVARRLVESWLAGSPG